VCVSVVLRGETGPGSSPGRSEAAEDGANTKHANEGRASSVLTRKKSSSECLVVGVGGGVDGGRAGVGRLRQRVGHRGCGSGYENIGLCVAKKIHGKVEFPAEN
jgi:hypothetical protein